MLDAVIVVEDLGRLFRVELGAHDRILFRFKGGYEGGAVVILAGGGDVPKGVERLIFGDLAWAEGPLVTVVGQVFLGEGFDFILLHLAEHFGLSWILCEIKSEVFVVGTIMLEGVIDVTGCEEGKSLKAEACTPKRVKVSLVIQSHSLFEYSGSGGVVVATSSREENRINLLHLLLNLILTIIEQYWNDSSTGRFNKPNVDAHDVGLVVVEAMVIVMMPQEVESL